jgi:hypothetical protein
MAVGFVAKRSKFFNVRFGSVAVVEYIPKAAARTAAIEGKADLAIERK